MDVVDQQHVHAAIAILERADIPVAEGVEVNSLV